MNRYGPLVAVAGLLLAAAASDSMQDSSGIVGVLLGAACVTLGAWLATEVWHVVQQNKAEADKDEESTE